MEKAEILEKAEKIVEEFFEKLGFKIEIQSLEKKDEIISFNLKSPDAQILIGEKGRVLLKLQHLLNLIFKKKTKESLFLDVDINSYKKEKTEYLKNLAQRLAQEVVLFKKEKILPPMPSYERRIIHLELASRGDVITESQGQEPKRRIVIRPYP